MKALSINSYYASAIACGLKYVELRSWGTHYTGKLLICSTKQSCKNKDVKDLFIFGKAIAVAELIGCEPVNEFYLKHAFLDEDDIISENCIAWAFSKVLPIKPFDVKGQQGLFNVDESNIEYLPFDVSTDEGAIALQNYWIDNGYIKERPWD